MIQKSNKPERRSGSELPKNQDKNNPIRKSPRQNPLQNGLQMDGEVFKQFLEAVPDGLIIVNTQGEIQFVNKQIEGMFGYQPEEMLGKPIEFLIPERFGGHKEHREAYFHNLHVRPMGSELLLFAARRDQTEFQVEISLSPIKIEKKNYIIAAIRDVTLQILTEKQLKQSQERYHQLLDNMLEGCQIIDFEWRYVYMNAVAASQGHSKPDELLTRTMMDVYPGIENTGLFSVLKQCMEERTPQHMENKFDNPDGTTGWFDLSIQPVPEGIFILSIDITERKQAEVSLIKSEKRFRALVEKSMEEVSMVGADGTLIFESPTVHRPLGYPPGTLLGHNLFELFHPDELSGATKLLEQIVGQPGSHREARFRLRHQDGSWRWMEGIVTNLLDEPAVQAVVINYRDVTEHKRAEDELFQSEERYRTLFEDSPISIWEEDFSAVKQRIEGLRQQGVTDFENYFSSHPEVVNECAALVRIVDVNKAALKLYRAQSKEDLRVNLADIFGPETLKHFQEELVCVAEGRTQYSWEGPEKILTGERIDVRLTWSIAPGHEEKLSKVIVSIIDITERKRAEEEIQIRTDELQTLYELSRALADTDDLVEILNQVNRHAVESVHTTFARVALLEGDTFVMRAAYPIRILDHDFLVGKREPVAMLPYCQRVLEQNKSVILRNSSQEVSGYERAALLLDFAQSLCLIPLRVSRPGLGSKQTLGLLMLGEARSEGREPFTPAKIRLSESIGDQAASAIRRMLLYEQTERRLQHLTALREIDQVIASSFGLDLSLRTVLTQVTEQLSVDAAAVWLYNSASNLLEYSAGRGFHSKVYDQAQPLRLGEGYAGRAVFERRTIHISNLTEQADNPRLLRALAKEPFVSYYSVPLIAKGNIKGVLEVFHRVLLEPDEEWLGFLHTLAGQAAIAIDNATLFENLQRSNTDLILAYDTTLEGWSAALDLRDKETEGHTQRVTQITVKLAEAMGFNQQELVQVRRGALLHDIGKMGVPDRILLKPDKLTNEEWEVMRMHPTYAYQMLKPISYLGSALDIPYGHHEKWDGTGYPRGLKGENIPLAARVFAVVDIYDALTSDRPYRKSWTSEKTLNYIRELSGTHLDPRVVEAFLKMVSKDE